MTSILADPRPRLSFEPVVNTPSEALDCFLRTKMDLLVMGDLMIERVVGTSDLAQFVSSMDVAHI